MRRVLVLLATMAVAVLASGTVALAQLYPPSGQGDMLSPPSASADGTFAISSSGWAPDSTVTVTIHSEPVVLGTLTADGSGTVQGRFTVPPGTPSGTHMLQVDGTDPSGAPRTVTMSLEVGATGSAGASRRALAFTGTDSVPLTVAGIVAVAVGSLFVVVARRRRSVAAAGGSADQRAGVTEAAARLHETAR